MQSIGQRTPNVLLNRGSYFEGPRWHRDRWYVSDLYQHHVIAVTPAGESAVIASVPGQPSGLGWMPDDTMLIVSMRDQRLLKSDSAGALHEHADLSALARGHCNDMIVDGFGRAFVGSFGFDLMGGGAPASSTIVAVEPDGSARVVADDMLFPNGMVIGDDGSTLIVAESFGGRLTAFTIDRDGNLSDRRVWAQLGPVPSWESLDAVISGSKVVPDGCAIDAEGAVWVADAFGGRAVRVLGGQEVDERRAPEGQNYYACAIGGPDGRTLLCCSAPSFSEHERRDKSEATLHTFSVDVPAS